MKSYGKYYNLFVCEPYLHFVEELLVKVVIKNCFWVISAWQSFLACSCLLTSFSLNVLIKLLLYKKVCFNFLVPHNVGLLCSVVLGTFLCILGINYAMLTPWNLNGFEKISWYCSQQLLSAWTRKTINKFYLFTFNNFCIIYLIN